MFDEKNKAVLKGAHREPITYIGTSSALSNTFVSISPDSCVVFSVNGENEKT